MPKKGKAQKGKVQKLPSVEVPLHHSNSVGPMHPGPGIPNSAMNDMLGNHNNSLPNLKELMTAKTENQMGIKLPSNNAQPGQVNAQNNAGGIPDQGGNALGSDAANFLYNDGNPGEITDKIVPRDRQYVKYASKKAPKKTTLKSKADKQKGGMKGWTDRTAVYRENWLNSIYSNPNLEDNQGEINTQLQEKYYPESISKKITANEMASLKGYTKEPNQAHLNPANFGGLDPAEKDAAWKEWSSSYLGINNFLRFNGKMSWQQNSDYIPEEYHQDIKKNINNATSAIQKSKTKQDDIMYRGMGRGGFMAALGLDTWPSTQEEANALVGRSFC